MALTSDPVAEVLERKLTERELALESERNRVNLILAECGLTKQAPAKDYWHKMHKLVCEVNLLRELLETKT